MTFTGGPLGQIGVIAFACDHQRRQQAYGLAAVITDDARGNRLGTLRLNGALAIGTVLRAQLDEQQTQEMMDLGQCGDRTLASATAGALFYGHRRWDAIDRIDVGT